MFTPRRFTVACLLLVASLAGRWVVPGVLQAETLPSKLSDDAFWQMVGEFSEPDGYFRSENLLSNENGFQQVIPDLEHRLPRGGVYLGVGPEQNFTYIAALQPKLAFIFDIRRQNLVEHLLYKALMEMATDRADFLSRLFSRPRPEGLDAETAVDALLAAYRAVEPSKDLFGQNLQAVRARLIDHHGFALTSDDLRALEHVYTAFFASGPDLSYSFGGGWYGAFPTYADLMMETDGQGEKRSYLATEDNFRTLRRLQSDNAIVPLVGDFAGPKAIRAVAFYLKQHEATATAFYTSNVEQYLFQQGEDWKRFLTNVAALPIQPSSTFIRSVSNQWAWSSSQGSRRRAVTKLCPIGDLVSAFNEGKISDYAGVVAMSR